MTATGYSQAHPSLLLFEAHEHLWAFSRQQRLLVKLIHVIAMMGVMRSGHGLGRDLGKEMIRLVRGCIREESREAGCHATHMSTALMSIGKARGVVVAVLARQVRQQVAQRPTGHHPRSIGQQRNDEGFAHGHGTVQARGRFQELDYGNTAHLL